MLVPEDIYDLDTLTLEDKTEQLEKVIRSYPPNSCPKGLRNTLELAKLQIRERLAIEEFGLNLGKELDSFSQHCLYPVEPKSETSLIPVAQDASVSPKIHETEHSTGVYNSRQLTKQFRQNIFEFIKATKLDQKFTIAAPVGPKKPVNNNKQHKHSSNSKKSLNKHVPEIPTIKNERDKVAQNNYISGGEVLRNKHSSTKSLKGDALPPKNYSTNDNKLKEDKPKVHSTTRHSMETSTPSLNMRKQTKTINIRSISTSSSSHQKIQLITETPKQDPSYVQTPTKLQPEMKESSIPPVVPSNNIKFIENDVYSSDDQSTTQGKPKDYTPLVIIAEKQLQQIQKVKNEMAENHREEMNQPVKRQLEDQFEILELIEKPKDASRSYFDRSIRQEIQQQIQGEEAPGISKMSRELKDLTKSEREQQNDKFDYFRLTITKKTKQQEQEKTFTDILQPDRTAALINVEDFHEQPKETQPQTIKKHETQRKNETKQEEVFPEPERSATVANTMTNTIITSPKRINDKAGLTTKITRTNPSYLRQSQQHKKTPMQKILDVLPVNSNIVPYHQFIPTFRDLFHPQADLFQLLKQLAQMLRQHNGTVDPINNFCPNLYRNMTEFHSYVNGSSDKIKLFGDKVDLDLSDFEHKDQIARLRAENLVQVPSANQILYYRVIKTKQEVYDIISSTFNRTTKWAELPHGMNLKSSWNLLWTWAKPQIDFKKLFYFQKVNHFPHNKHLSRKDMLKKNIEKLKRLGNKAQSLFDIMPESYLLPGQNNQFVARFLQEAAELGTRNLWILKPVGQSRGRGISLVNALGDILYTEPVVLQKYLQNPLLLDGYKFDMRIYVLLTSINPLQVFLYRQGFARLSTQKYTLNLDELGNNYVHLTNFAIQKENFVKDGFSFGGTKISLKMLKERLARMGINWSSIWNQVIDVVLKSCIACMNEIPPNPNCFQLFGYDIIIDSQQKCWLLQVNSSPSLEREFILDEIVKQQLIDDTIQVVNPVPFDRQKLIEVLQRRALEHEGRKSLINTVINTTAQLDRDLHYILDGKTPRKYGEKVATMKNYQMIAPGDRFQWLLRVVNSYKVKKQ